MPCNFTPVFKSNQSQSKIKKMTTIQQLETTLKATSTAYLFIEGQSFTKYQIGFWDGIFNIYVKKRKERKFHKASLTTHSLAPIIEYIEQTEKSFAPPYFVRRGINNGGFKYWLNDKFVADSCFIEIN